VAETRLLLLGGSSEIAVAIARRMAADGPVRPFLLGRNRELLEQALALLESAGCIGGELGVLDAEDLEAHGSVIADAFARSGGFDVVVLAIGVLGAQSGLDADVRESLEVMRVNFVDCGSLLLHSLRALRRQGGGTLVVLSSVAAERPRIRSTAPPRPGSTRSRRGWLTVWRGAVRGCWWYAPGLSSPA
jgi:decaprenylphospho-beta-D-erythro-pentofuranosid-2-ulose 2-reductase